MSLTSLEEISPGIYIEQTMVEGEAFDPGGIITEPPTALHTGAANGLVFNFNAAAGTPQAVIDGFSEAGDLWSALLQDNVTINIDIDFTALGPGILGTAATDFGSVSYANIRNSLTGDQTSNDDISAVANLQAQNDVDLLLNRTSNSPNGAGSPVTLPGQRLRCQQYSESIRKQ